MPSPRMDFVFHPLAPADLPLIHAWLNRPHVRAAFGEPHEWLAEITANLSSTWVRHFRADLAHSPGGFAQYYDTALAPHGPWSSQPAGTVGIDFLLGETELLHRGLGTRLLREFTAFVVRTSQARRLVLDPDPQNLPSIKAAEAVGFSPDPLTGLWLKDSIPLIPPAA